MILLDSRSASSDSHVMARRGRLKLQVRAFHESTYSTTRWFIAVRQHSGAA